MTHEAQQIAIYEMMGWSGIHYGPRQSNLPTSNPMDEVLRGFRENPDCIRRINIIPPITLDLLHELVMTLKSEDNPVSSSPQFCDRYIHWLATVCIGGEVFDNGDLRVSWRVFGFALTDATIAQRTEAILRAAGKWVEEKV